MSRLCSSLETHLLTTALALVPLPGPHEGQGQEPGLGPGLGHDSEDIRGVVREFQTALAAALTSSTSSLSSLSSSLPPPGSPLSPSPSFNDNTTTNNTNHNHHSNSNNNSSHDHVLVDLVDLMLAFRSVPPHAGCPPHSHTYIHTYIHSPCNYTHTGG